MSTPALLPSVIIITGCFLGTLPGFPPKNFLTVLPSIYSLYSRGTSNDSYKSYSKKQIHMQLRLAQSKNIPHEKSEVKPTLFSTIRHTVRLNKDICQIILDNYSVIRLIIFLLLFLLENLT